MSDRSFVYDAMFEISLQQTAESIARCYLLNSDGVEFVNFLGGETIEEGGCCHYSSKFAFNALAQVQVDLSLINPREVNPPGPWTMESALIEARHWDGYLFFDERGVPNKDVFRQCLYPHQYTADDLILDWRILAIQLIVQAPMLNWAQRIFCKIEDLRVLYHEKQWCGIPPVPEDDKDELCFIAQKKGYLLGGSA